MFKVQAAEAMAGTKTKNAFYNGFLFILEGLVLGLSSTIWKLKGQHTTAKDRRATVRYNKLLAMITRALAFFESRFRAAIGTEEFNSGRAIRSNGV